MDELTPDELHADAIAYVALDVLDGVADTPEARSRFLRDILALMVRHGRGQATANLGNVEH